MKEDDVTAFRMSDVTGDRLSETHRGSRTKPLVHKPVGRPGLLAGPVSIYNARTVPCHMSGLIDTKRRVLAVTRNRLAGAEVPTIYIGVSFYFRGKLSKFKFQFFTISGHSSIFLKIGSSFSSTK